MKLQEKMYQSEGYQLVWADGFDKGARPDPKNWNYENGFVRNEEAQWYQPENAFCQNRQLVIEARREQKKNSDFRADAPKSDWKRSREFAEYTAASLTTRGKQEWQYGRFEMRARIPIRPGLWPAFWTIGTAGEWPACGEIDIMEYYRGSLLANVAWGTTRRLNAKWDSTKKPVESLGGEKWAQEFHTWRMDWTEDAIRLSVDNLLLNETLLKDTLNADGKNPFKQSHYILLNFAVGGQNGGDPAPTKFPARFEVDWVRVYQKK